MTPQRSIWNCLRQINPSIGDEIESGRLSGIRHEAGTKCLQAEKSSNSFGL